MGETGLAGFFQGIVGTFMSSHGCTTGAVVTAGLARIAHSVGTMMNRLFVTGLLATALFACAADPNKQANDAHDAELASQRKATETGAEQRSESRVNAAEVVRENTVATAGGTEASQESAAAGAKMKESRDVFRAKATARLEKLDARTAELKANIERARGQATTASRDALKTIETQRSMATRDLDQLPRVANEEWSRAKSSLDTQLDTLEGLVKKVATEAERFKK